MDGNFDNSITVPKEGGGGTEAFYGAVAVFSAGPDGKLGTEDDVNSFVLPKKED